PAEPPSPMFTGKEDFLLGTATFEEKLAAEITRGQPGLANPAPPVADSQPPANAFLVLPAEESPATAPAAPPPDVRRWGYRPWLRGAFWVWLAGALGWFALAFVRMRRFAQLLRLASPAPPWLSAEAQALAARMGLRRCPCVWLVPGSIAPLVWAPRF